MSNNTVAAGGDKILKDGMYAIRLGDAYKINEIPNSGVGPNGRYKKFSVMGSKYSFEGFSLEHTGILREVYETQDEALAVVKQRKAEHESRRQGLV